MLSDIPYIAPFPPLFGESPWIYGLAVFSNMLVSALALAQLMAYAMDGRRKRQVARLLGHTSATAVAFFSLLNIHKLIISCLLLTLCLRALPDTVAMLAWGEVSLRTMKCIIILNWCADIMALFPCIGALTLIAWSWQGLPQRLAEGAHLPLAPLKWNRARQPCMIALLVTVIAVCVTLGKASV